MRRESTVHWRVYFQKEVEILVSWSPRNQAMTRLHFTFRKCPQRIRIIADPWMPCRTQLTVLPTGKFPILGFTSSTGIRNQGALQPVSTSCSSFRGRAGRAGSKLGRPSWSFNIHSTRSLWPLLRIILQNIWNKCLGLARKSSIFKF